MQRTVSFIAVMVGAALFAGTALAADKIQVGDGKVFPESFGAAADGTVYAGSITMGVIFKAAPGATKAEKFVDAPTDGPTAVLGVYVDKGGMIWACYSDLALFAGQPGKPSVLRSYDPTGAVKATYTLPDGSFCNDVTSTADGTAYVADTFGARILRIAPGSTTMEEWLVDKANLVGIDGITLSPDGKLYVNNVMSGALYRVDIGADGKAGAVTKLTTSAPLKGPDGMRFGSDGVLYLAENGAGQADAITNDGDNATVKPVITGLDAPTAVDKPGDQLWVLEAKIDKMQDANENGPFWIVPAP